MFRCVSELKGLIIDIDSFSNEDICVWEKYSPEYKCLFITESVEKKRVIGEKYGHINVMLGGQPRFFLPNERTHKDALNLLNIEPSEVAYISRDVDFLDNAMGFLGGTIWITEQVSYLSAGKAPDMVCRNLEVFEEALKRNGKGFLGESKIYYGISMGGLITTVEFDVDGETVPLYMLGRYFGHNHYMYHMHAYSAIIVANKKPGGKLFGRYNDFFGTLISLVVKRLQLSKSIDGICAVPEKPSQAKRFNNILDVISNTCNIENYQEAFICLRDYRPQKGFARAEREENVKGAFLYTGNLSGKRVIIIDDIITTGETIKECIRELKNKGASEVLVIALAINQIGKSYWSSSEPEIICKHCGRKMLLLINSQNKSFFYGCPFCMGETYSFEEGERKIQQYVDNEFAEKPISEIEEIVF